MTHRNDGDATRYQHFTNIAKQGVIETYHRLNRPEQELANKWPYIFIHATDAIIGAAKATKRRKVLTSQVMWVSGSLKLADINDVPNDAVFPTMTMDGGYGQELVEEYSVFLDALRESLKGESPPAKPTLTLVVNNS